MVVGERFPGPAPLNVGEETADGALRPYLNPASDGTPEPGRRSGIVRRGSASPTAERLELRGELRRVVYGRAEPVLNESVGLLNEPERFRRRQQAGRPSEQHGKVEQDADEGVPVVTNVQRLDAEGAFGLPTGDGGSALDKTPWQDFHPQRGDKEDRRKDSQRGAQPTIV